MRTAPVLVSLVLAFGLTGCGSDSATPEGSTSQSAAAAHNDADIAFVNGMTPHHEGALEMSELAETRAASEDVKALAERIAAAQGPEIEQMADLAADWGVEVEPDGEHGGGHSTDMPDDAAALEPLSGAEFDREFLKRMIAHHEGALVMAEAELAEGKSAEAKELAEAILASQKAEIAEMEQLLTKV